VVVAACQRNRELARGSEHREDLEPVGEVPRPLATERSALFNRIDGAVGYAYGKVREQN
jgi:hypothetical protein